MTRGQSNFPEILKFKKELPLGFRREDNGGNKPITLPFGLLDFCNIVPLYCYMSRCVSDEISALHKDFGWDTLDSSLTRAVQGLHKPITNWNQALNLKFRSEEQRDPPMPGLWTTTSFSVQPRYKLNTGPRPALGWRVLLPQSVVSCEIVSLT
ncbi:hypothetical protein VNO77_19158 [Canavalia gladiata]|uniref:Uncharacterized protein n=1 Tax=Canavalia gladiata TaxID=3824 RepID=A0AAN9LQH1_CANGL